MMAALTLRLFLNNLRIYPFLLPILTSCLNKIFSDSRLPNQKNRKASLKRL